MSNRTVLITGCSSGVGRAAAYAFLDEEWRVYATARNPADIETLDDAGCRIGTIDVRSGEDVARVVDTCEGAGLSRKVARLRPLAVIKG